jgi:hypothetical protein
LCVGGNRWKKGNIDLVAGRKEKEEEDPK